MSAGCDPPSAGGGVRVHHFTHVHVLYMHASIDLHDLYTYMYMYSTTVLYIQLHVCCVSPSNIGASTHN